LNPAGLDPCSGSPELPFVHVDRMSACVAFSMMCVWGRPVFTPVRVGLVCGPVCGCGVVGSWCACRSDRSGNLLAQHPRVITPEDRSWSGHQRLLQLGLPPTRPHSDLCLHHQGPCRGQRRHAESEARSLLVTCARLDPVLLEAAEPVAFAEPKASLPGGGLGLESGQQPWLSSAGHPPDPAKGLTCQGFQIGGHRAS
jgi:hypothetical protein